MEGCCFEGSHRFGADMELEGCSKEQRRFEEGNGGSYGPSAKEEEGGGGLVQIELFKSLGSIQGAHLVDLFQHLKFEAELASEKVTFELLSNNK